MKITDNVEVPRDVTEADMLLYVLDGWTSDDDWGMPSYPYPDTCRELLEDLRAGDDPWALRRIGSVAEDDSGYAALAARVPHHATRG